MKANAFIRLIDAGYGISRKAPLPGSNAGEVPLMPDTGEYCEALRRLSALGSSGPAGRGVPDEIFLHLFSYELLERMRDQAQRHQGGKAELLILPFWPECLFHAAGLPVHSAREIRTIFPAAEQTYYARRPEMVIEQEARRVLGNVRFDPGAYIEAIEATAVRSGWMIIDPHAFRPAEIRPMDGQLPRRSTAGALLVREGKLLLERRPDDARVYPGMWDLPGGHLERGESPEAALLREMEEELSIIPRRFFLAATQDDHDPATGAFYRHFVYIVTEWDGEIVQREGREIRWLRYQEALRLELLNPLIGSALLDFLDKDWLPG